MPDIRITCSCPLIFVHRMLGGKWKMRILWHIIHGENRFSELKKALPEISEKVLYTSLRELEEAEILIREVEREQKPSIIRYYLAEEYAEVKEMISAAHSFAEKYVRKNEIRQCQDLQKSKVLQEKEKLCIVETE